MFWPLALLFGLIVGLVGLAFRVTFGILKFVLFLPLVIVGVILAATGASIGLAAIIGIVLVGGLVLRLLRRLVW